MENENSDEISVEMLVKEIVELGERVMKVTRVMVELKKLGKI